MIEQIVVAAGVMALLLLVTVGVAVTVVVRGVRRRYRALRARVLRGGTRPDLQDMVRDAGSVMSTSLGSPGWWTVQGRRHRMWRAVTSAEHAVGVAQRADAAVGDLPDLVRRLRSAADAVDAVLRASGRLGRLRPEDRLDCDRIVATAVDLREAALASLRADSHRDTDTVVSAVQIEVAALAAGVRATHR